MMIIIFLERIISILTVLLISILKIEFQKKPLFYFTKILFCIYNPYLKVYFREFFFIFLIFIIFMNFFFTKIKRMVFLYCQLKFIISLVLFLGTRYSGIFIYAAILIFFLINYRKPTFKIIKDFSLL